MFPLLRLFASSALAESERSRLQEKFQHLPPRLRTTYPSLDRTLRLIKLRDSVLNQVRPQPIRAPDDQFWSVPIPPNTTYRKTLAAKERVRAFDEQMRPRLIRFLQRPGGKELVFEMPKGAIDNLTKVLGPITEAFPIFKPGVEIMKTMVNETLKQRLKSKIAQLIADAGKDPASLDHSLPRVSREVTIDAKPDVPPKIHQQYKQELAKLRYEITELQHGIAKLETPRPTAQPHAYPTERAALPRAYSPQAREQLPDFPIRPRDPDISIRPRTPDSFGDRSFDPSPPGGGGFGQSTFTSSCVCNTFINGALVSSVPISVGAKCGPHICGRDMPIR